MAIDLSLRNPSWLKLGHDSSAFAGNVIPPGRASGRTSGGAHGRTRADTTYMYVELAGLLYMIV